MSEEVKEKKQLSPKAKKIINIVVDVVVAIVLVFAAFLAIVSIRSKAKGFEDYTEVFGTAYVGVATPSMEGEKPAYVPEGKPEGFNKGDLIKLRLVNEEEAKKLEVGDIISFRTNSILEDKYVLNTHRIVEINKDAEGNVKSFTTRGDNNPANDFAKILTSEVVGVYEGKAPGIGHVFLFMGSSTGFFVCIVLPTLLIVAYCVFNLIVTIRKEKKVQDADAELEKQAEKERLRQEILAEMQGEQKPATPEEVEEKEQPEEKEEVEQPTAEVEEPQEVPEENKEEPETPEQKGEE